MHKLRNYRESYGLTVADLSILSDISVGAIHRIESGSNPYKVIGTLRLVNEHEMLCTGCNLVVPRAIGCETCAA